MKFFVKDLFNKGEYIRSIYADMFTHLPNYFLTKKFIFCA